MKQLVPNFSFLLAVLSLPFLSEGRANADTYGLKGQSTFIENKGQIIDQNGKQRLDIDFKLENKDLLVFVGKGTLHYQWMEYKEKGNSEKVHANTYRLDINLVGANKTPRIIEEDIEPYVENYYLPQTTNGVTARSCRKITYKDIYPNIDWEIVSTDEGKTGLAFKHNFVIHRGGDYRQIKIEYSGATNLAIIDGSITATTPYGHITEQAPYTWEASTYKPINTAYTLQNNILSYDISGLKASEIPGEFIIDPAINIDWATYHGGSSNEYYFYVSNICDADLAGNPYLCGSTLSLNNIATSGAPQNAIAGGVDGFIAKFNSAGQKQWATYYGSTGTDGFTSVSCVGTNEVYVVGFTSATGMSAGTVQQGTYGGGNNDGLLVRLNSGGIRQWATYYGGADSDIIIDVTHDGSGNIVIGGVTKSNNNIATTGSYSSSTDGFTAKFLNTGMRVWGRYIGDVGAEFIYSVAVDDADNVYCGGETWSSGNISSGTVQQQFYGGSRDGLLAKYNSSGSLQWATYYGGSAYDYIRDVTCDHFGNVYIGGETGSDNNISTLGAYHYTRFSNDGFFARFTSSGTRAWGSYLNTADVASLIADNNGDFYLTGFSGSSIGIATSDAYKPAPNAGDAIFMKFNNSGTRLYGSYFGGNSYDAASCIRLSPTGKILFAGITTSSLGLATPNGAQNTYGGPNISGFGDGDLFLASFQLDTMSFFPLPYTDTLFCAGDSVHVPYGVNSKFNSSNTFTLQMSNASGSFATPTNIATRASDTAGILNGRIPIGTTNGIGYRFRIVSSSPIRTSDRDTLPIQIKPVALGFSASSNTPICAGDTLKLYGATTSSGITWSWTGPVSFTSSSKDTIITNAQSNRAGDYILTATLNGCSIRDTETVTVKPLPAKPNAGSNTPLCAGSNLNLTATSTTTGVSWSWTGPTSFSSTSQNPTRTSVTTADAGNYIVSAILNGCASKDTETVVINPIPPAPTAGSNSPLCSGNTLTLTASPLSGATYSWTGPGGFGAASQNASRTNVQVTDAGAYNVTATVNGCTSPAGTVNVTITAGPTVNIYVNPNDTVCAGMPATLVALPLNGGTTPQIKWYRNGNLTSITTTTYVVAAPVNNDVFYCELTNNTTCAVPATANSNSITMTVLPVTPPSVTVSPTFTSPQDPYSLLTFTATGANGGSNPQYQWTHNHQLVAGATSSTWSTQGLYLSQFNTICVIMTSSELCAIPKTDTACTAVQILLGLEDFNKGNIELYPNPNDGRFTINATGIRTGEVIIELYDVMGQLIHRQAAEIRQGRIHENVDLGMASAGLYILRIKGEGVSYQTSIIKR